MDLKQIVIDNAWGGLSMDYGLLHVQLATPLLMALTIFIMVVVLNKLLFQPVLRTLDNRKKIIEESKHTVETTRAHINKLSQEYEKKLESARVEINEVLNVARGEALKQKDALLAQARSAGDEEIERGKAKLQTEVESAKTLLQAISEQLAGVTAKHLLH
ncbi:ATP synthase F0 subunit B [Deltaproteobacteria bacterium TL4]